MSVLRDEDNEGCNHLDEIDIGQEACVTSSKEYEDGEDECCCREQDWDDC